VSGDINIVVVEDYDTDVDLIERGLRDTFGSEVGVAIFRSYSEAALALQPGKLRVDLFILDVILPESGDDADDSSLMSELNGDDDYDLYRGGVILADLIRRVESYQHVPIIFYTATPSDSVQGFDDTGRHTHLKKRIKVNDLMARARVELSR